MRRFERPLTAEITSNLVGLAPRNGTVSDPFIKTRASGDSCGVEQSAAAVLSETHVVDRPSEVPPSGVRASTPFAPELEPKRRRPGTYDRRKTTEERRAEQRMALIDAAARVFARDGFADASVAAIIDYADMSRGTFYRNFRDLSDVFLATRQAAADLAYERVRSAALVESDPASRLRAGIRAFLEQIAEHGDLARVFLREAPADGRAHERLYRDTIDRFAGLWRESLVEAKRRGVVREVAEDNMIYAVLHGIAGMAVRYVENYDEAHAIDIEPVLVEMCRRVFR